MSKQVYFRGKKILNLAIIGIFGAFLSLLSMEFEEANKPGYPPTGEALGLLVNGRIGPVSQDNINKRLQSTLLDKTSSNEHGQYKLDAWTLIHAAVYDGNVAIIKHLLLLNPKPDMTIKTASNTTPLELGILGHKKAPQAKKGQVKSGIETLLNNYNWTNPKLIKGFERIKDDLAAIGIKVSGYESKISIGHLEHTLVKLEDQLASLLVLLNKLIATN